MDNLKEFSEKIKNNLTIEEVKDLLFSFGGDPVIKGETIISRTICHGGHSHKLYYYNNTHLFKCYTDCGDNGFDIYELVMKINKLENINMSLLQSILFVCNFYNLTFSIENFSQNDNNLEDWKILNKYQQNINKNKEEKIIDFKYYDDKILRFLPHPHILPWEKEGISREVMEKYGICYDPSSEAIVIPHRDKDNNLLGIRERTLIKENEVYGKYRPAYLNNQMYNHPLGYALYNLNNSKDNIKKIKKAILFEGEKSCLLYASMFGIENDITVAVCGSNITSYQMQLLLDLGVKEVIVAFDRQFKKIGDEEWKVWTDKLKNINTKYSSKVQVSFMFDKWNLLKYKDSPIDEGKETFLTLFKERVVV